MALVTIFLTIVSLTTPALEELSQRTEPWVREDVTITSVSEFHTSDFLREDEPVLLLHHAFLDDENETLRTVVCTDTRVIVLEEGLVQREIVLEHTINHANISPMGMFLVTHRNMDAPSSVRSLRVDTETGEQIHFTTHPGREMQVNEPWTWPQDDGSLVTRLGSYLWFFDTDLNPVQELRVSPWGSDVWAARNADIVFVSGTTLSAYNRRGELLWTISDKYNRARVNSAAISDDGSLVGLATRDGAFLFNGATGSIVKELQIGNTGTVLFSPSSSWVILGYRDVEGTSKYTFVETETEITQTVRRYAIPNPANPSPGAQSVFDNGMVLFCDLRSFSCIVVDEALAPVYYYGNRVKPYPAALSSSGQRLVHAVEQKDSLPSFTLMEMER